MKWGTQAHFHHLTPDDGGASGRYISFFQFWTGWLIKNI